MRELSLYVNKETAVSRMDARAKLVATAALFVVALSFNHPLYLLGLLLIEAWLVVASRSLVNIKRVRVLLGLLFVFSAVMWALFLREGELLFRIGPLKVYTASALYGLAMGLRLVSMVVAGLIFLSATMVEEFLFALRKFGLPMPVAFAFSLAFRMVSQLVRTAGTVKQAQQIRGLDVDSGGILARIKKHVPLLIPVFIYSIKSVDALTRALEARGFGCTRKQTPFIISTLRTREYAVMAASVAAAVACIILRLKGFGEVVSRL
jgi:energy-coupling factor transport system permease protein